MIIKPKNAVLLIVLIIVGFYPTSQAFASISNFGAGVKLGYGSNGAEVSGMVVSGSLSDKIPLGVFLELEASKTIDFSDSKQNTTYGGLRLGLKQSTIFFDTSIGLMNGKSDQSCFIECNEDGRFYGEYEGLVEKVSLTSQLSDSVGWYINIYRIIHNYKISGIRENKFDKNGGVSLGFSYLFGYR